VFIEEDFEIFLDPDGDEFNYYEWQINPLGTVYDVIWERPPQTPGPEARGLHGFDLAPMLTGYRVKGTVWERADVDSGWTAEVALSWEGLSRIPGRFRAPPWTGDTWRIGFSRVESPRPPHWQADWTWPIHGEYNMHIGQRDGYVQFSEVMAGSGPAPFHPVPRLYAAGMRLEPAAPDGGLPTGRPVTVELQIGNAGAAAGPVEARLACRDSLVTVLDSVAAVGGVGTGESRWAEDGFAVRLSRAAEPGRNVVFQLALRDEAGRWWGDYFFAFAGGRTWRTAFQLHEGVQALLVDGDDIWGISRANVWRWGPDGAVRGFYQADDGLPRHARVLARDGRGRIWVAGERGAAFFDGQAWHELTGRQGLPPRGFERLSAGPDGAMWIACRDGLFRYGDRLEAVWTAAQGYAPGQVRDLLVARDGAAWVVGDSLVYVADGDRRQVLGARHGLPSDRLTAVAEDGAGAIWLAGVPTGRPYRDGGVGRFDGRDWTVWRRQEGLAANEVTALFADREDRIWAGYPDGSLSLYDGTAWDSWSPAVPDSGPLMGGSGGFLHDGQGRIWLVGRSGLAMYDGRGWQTWTWRNGLFGGPASAVVQGPGDRVYIGDGRSLSYYQP
ncbi:MAG: hypothetical protein ABIL09_12430, partial [Gemmatimonadota bacterium]